MTFLPTSASAHARPSMQTITIGRQSIINAAFEDFSLIADQFPLIDIFVFDTPAVDNEWTLFQYEEWFQNILSVINRHAAPNAALILIPQNRKGGTWLKSTATASIIQSSEWNVCRHIIWKQKQADFHRAGYPFREIFFFRRGTRPMNNKSSLRYKDIIDIKAPQSSGYGGEIPVEIIKVCISLFYQPGDIVMDPFAGTGSVAAACYELDYTSISIELDQETYENIVKRVKGLKGRLI